MKIVRCVCVVGLLVSAACAGTKTETNGDAKPGDQEIKTGEGLSTDDGLPDERTPEQDADSVGGDATDQEQPPDYVAEASEDVKTDGPNPADVELVDVVPGNDSDSVSPNPDAEDTSSPQPIGYFPSAELGIKILGPSATGTAQALGASIQVAGLVVGKPDAIIWESQTGQTGYAEGAPFWLSGKVDLVQGDNLITVTAVKGEEEASDYIIITYNPAFLFGDVLRIRPGAMFTNTSSKLVFSLDMGLYSNFEPSTLWLCESTEDGQCISDIHTLKDDGQVNVSCDEVGEDSVFSYCKSYQLAEPGRLCFRTHAVVKAGYQQYTAYSPVVCVDVVHHISKEECEGVMAIQKEADKAYWDTLATSDPTTARAAAISLLQSKTEDVAEVGASSQGYGVWVRYANGLLGAFNFSPTGLRGGENEEGEGQFEQLEAPVDELLVESKRSIVLSPYHTEFGLEDEATFVHNVLDKSECPAYVLESPYYDAKANLTAFRGMWEYGVIAIASHGDSYFKQMTTEAKKEYLWTHMQSQELIWTGETVDCANLLQTSPTCTGTCEKGAECVITQSSGQGTQVSGICVDHRQVDLRTGRAVFGPDRYGILPAFVKKYRNRGFPNSLVYLGTCRSLWNGTLGMEFFGAGAKAVVGYSGYVTSTFAYQQAADFFSNVIEDMKLTGKSVPENPIEDPQNPGTVLRLLGATNLNATNSDLINPSWETGNLTGWQKSGDGRVVSRLGITVPVEGKFMALISTGMGYTPQVGEIYQTFCIPDDKSEMCFYWKYYSEEFKEWCGSIYQDTFEATVEGEEGMVTCVTATVDCLCPPEECMGCGSCYDGINQADIILDQGDVWMTVWRKTCCNIAGLAGKGAVDLRFFATDKGDSIYDTVILIDAIKFK